MPKKPDEKKLEEAERVAELLELGMTKEQVAERMNLSPTTVTRRLKLWRKHVGTKREEDVDRLESAQTIMSTIQGILSNMRVSERLGEITGADVATIEQTLKRIMSKKATKSEIHKIFSNVTGVIRGYIEGKEIHKSLDLPNREPLVDREEVEELREEVEKLKALVTVPSSSRRKKKSKRDGERS